MGNGAKTVWQVKTSDHKYSGNNYTYLLRGKSAAAVEPRALKLAKDDRQSRPYIISIERVGDLDD